ncbi:diguanylate cyclase (GGDEF) domain-containing protein [Rhizobium sp. RU35A]|uniref:GGDEF domain-containing protein n=1 Tax=Rhizobium sp. RU35A TaxID=1907414 RepID=UPI000953AE5D|nr:GGDEF domain-containing protein [Rhizobium sp. RU35A]SIP90041.1 diguanylate cyclase (GGDEF) domain-containing protein [Rhizobium sp. RU35A]
MLKTALLLWAVEAATLSVLLLAMWANDRRQTVVLAWSLGFAANALGAALVGLRGEIPDYLSIVVGNGFQALALSCWAAGVRHYDDRKSTVWLLTPVTIWLIGMHFPFFASTFWMRVFLFQCISALGYGMIAYVLAEPKLPPRNGRLVFACIALVQSLLMIYTGIACLFVRPETFSEIPNGFFYTVINIFCLVSGILFGAHLLMSRTERRLQQLIVTDPLTGVLNRRGFLEQVQAMRARPPAGKLMLALAVFDLDHFKRINDRYGHKGGDAVLIAFCRSSIECIGTRGIFGRIGGEEFACLLHVASPAEAVGIIEAIRLSLMRQRIGLAGTDRIIIATVSCGVTVSSILDAEVDDMLSNADRALYAAKAAGRNATVLHDGKASYRVSDGQPREEPPQTSGQDTSVTSFPLPPLPPLSA